MAAALLRTIFAPLTHQLRSATAVTWLGRPYTKHTVYAPSNVLSVPLVEFGLGAAQM